MSIFLFFQYEEVGDSTDEECSVMFLQLAAYYLFRDVVKGCCQHTVGTGLSSKGFTYEHETMSHYHHLKDLQDLLNKEISDLEVHASAVFLNSLQQNAVVSIGEHDPWEEVRSDTLRSKSKFVVEK